MANIVSKNILFITNVIDETSSTIQSQAISSISVSKQDTIFTIKQDPLKIIVVKHPPYKNHIVIEKTDNKYIDI
jgi:hypothetical protein